MQTRNHRSEIGALGCLSAWAMVSRAGDAGGRRRQQPSTTSDTCQVNGQVADSDRPQRGGDVIERVLRGKSSTLLFWPRTTRSPIVAVRHTPITRSARWRAGACRGLGASPLSKPMIG